MAKKLSEVLSKFDEIKLSQEVYTNQIFATMPTHYITELQKDYFFYVWNAQSSEVRFVCSWDTTKEDIELFEASLKNIVTK